MEEKHNFKVGDTAYIYRVSEPLENVMDMKCTVIQDCSDSILSMYLVRTQSNVELFSLADDIYDNPVSVIKRIRSRIQREMRKQEDFLKTLDDEEKQYMEEASEYYQPDMFEEDEK